MDNINNKFGQHGLNPGKINRQGEGGGRKAPDNAEQAEEKASSSPSTNFLPADEIFGNLNALASEQKSSLVTSRIAGALESFFSNKSASSDLDRIEQVVREELPGYSAEEYALLASEIFTNEQLGIPSISLV